MGRGAAEIPPPAGGGYRRPLDCRGRGRAASDFSHPPLRGDARVLPLGLPAPGFEGGGPALSVPGGDPYLRRLPLARPPPALLIWRGDTILVRALSVRTERSASVHIDLDGQDGHGMLIGSAIAEAASIRWTISPRRTSPRCRHPVGTQVTLCCRSPQASASSWFDTAVRKQAGGRRSGRRAAVCRWARPAGHQHAPDSLELSQRRSRRQTIPHGRR
jgi:hypothetical protein